MFSQDTHVAISYVTHREEGEGLYSVVTGSLIALRTSVATVSIFDLTGYVRSCSYGESFYLTGYACTIRTVL